MRINSSTPPLLMAKIFIRLCLKNGLPRPWDAEDSQGLPHRVVAQSGLANSFCQQMSRKKWRKTSRFHYRLCCKSLLTWPGSSSTCHFSFPHLLLCQKICLLKIHSGLSCGLTPSLLQVVRCSGCFSNSNGIKVQG